jgi:hypothetical protein
MQWEYKVIAREIGPGLNVEEILNGMGAQGWHAFSVEHLVNNHLWLFFEREVAA